MTMTSARCSMGPKRFGLVRRAGELQSGCPAPRWRSRGRTGREHWEGFGEGLSRRNAIRQFGSQTPAGEASRCHDDALLLLTSDACWFSGGAFSNRELPVRPDEMAGIAMRNAFKVVLMLGFSLPEVTG